MSSNSYSDGSPSASPNFSGQEPFSSLHVTALEAPVSPSPPYLSPNTPSLEHASSAPRYSTLETAEKGYATGTATPLMQPASTEPQKKSWSRKKFIIVVSIVVLVVLGAVLGGVLGGVLGKRSGGGESSGGQGSSTPTTPATTVTPTMLGSATPDSIYTIPTAVSWGAPHLEVFSFTSQGKTVWKYKDIDSLSADTDAGWAQSANELVYLDSFAAPVQHAPVIFTRGGEYTNLFFANGEQTGDVLLKEHNSTMEWYPNGTTDWWNYVVREISTAPGIVTWLETEMILFAVGSSEYNWNLWYFIWNTNSTEGDGLSAARTEDWVGNWTRLGGVCESYTPTVLSWGSQRMDVFVVDRDDRTLQHEYYEDTDFQGTFESLGGYLTSRPVAVNATRGRIDVFALGGDSGLWWLPFDGGYAGSWGNWTGISHSADGTSPVIRGEPAAIVHDDIVSVFAWSDEGKLLYKKLNWQDDVWEPELGMEEVGEGLIGPPSVMSYLPGRLEVFAHIDGNVLGYRSWNYDTNTWAPEVGWENLGVIE